MPLQLTEVIFDPDLGEAYVVNRTTGQFALGGFATNAPTNINMFGTVTTVSPEELQQIPEGDRVLGTRSFYSTQRIFETSEMGVDGSGAQPLISDEITYHGSTWKIVRVFDYSAYGYWKAVGARIEGN